MFAYFPLSRITVRRIKCLNFKITQGIRSKLLVMNDESKFTNTCTLIPASSGKFAIDQHDHKYDTSLPECAYDCMMDIRGFLQHP